MRERLSKAEITKDAWQHTVEAGAETVASVSTILATAVRDVAHAMGGFATEVFEIREAARRARAAEEPEEPGAPSV